MLRLGEGALSEKALSTKEGISVPAVTAKQTPEVDRILQMTKTVGRSPAENVLGTLGDARGEATILAGGGGNGGGLRSVARPAIEDTSDRSDGIICPNAKGEPN